MANPGDISINTLTVGNLNLLNPSAAKYLEINIYEDLINPLLLGTIDVLDENDAIGSYQINGKETVNFGFSVDGCNDKPNLTFNLFKNKNLDDKSSSQSGAMKHKTYTLQIVSPEIIKNESNYIQKSFNDSTSNIVKKSLETISNRTIELPDQTKGQQRLIAQSEKVFAFLNKIKHRHVSQKYKSSSYMLFSSRNNGKETFKFCTLEYLMDQPSKMTFRQTNTSGNKTTSYADGMYDLIWVEAPDSFNSATRNASATNRSTYNMHTGVQQSYDKKNDSKYVVLGSNTVSSTELSTINNVPKFQKPIRTNIIDPNNDISKTNVAQAHADKAGFMAHITQNTIKFAIHGNPDIKVGDVVTLDIPKKSDVDGELGETQMNDKVLIVRLRHKIGKITDSPRYTMIIEAVKAAYRDNIG